jgi:hypothetical protein
MMGEVCQTSCGTHELAQGHLPCYWPFLIKKNVQHFDVVVGHALSVDIIVKQILQLKYNLIGEYA